MTALSTDPTIADALAALTLEEKVQLLTGRDFWSTWPVEKIGLRRILVSDGPSGVRGETWDERDPSLNLPSATALASSWDPDIARRYGAAAAVEARRKGVDVVLGPTINLHRSPLGGRHFEAFSEDPVLTAGPRRRLRARRAGQRRRRHARSTTWPTTPRPTASPWTSGSATAPCASCTCSRSSRPSPRRTPGS